MASINDKKDAEWQRLRKQKISYQARLRNRQAKENVIDQATLIEKVLEVIVNDSASTIPAEKIKAFYSAI